MNEIAPLSLGVRAEDGSKKWGVKNALVAVIPSLID
jgi:hypothetical protein